MLWFMRMSCMSYLGLSFQLLELHESLTFYRSIYFSGHLLVLCLYVIGRLIRPYVLAHLDEDHHDKKHS